MIKFIGEPLQDGPTGWQPALRIATVFPQARTIVTVPGIHATQRQAFTDDLNRQRSAEAQPVLTADEELALWMEAVDLIVQPDRILIRPDPERMDLAFEADSLLQELTSKRKIRFLFVDDQWVRDAIRRRGEAWRIHPLPRSTEQIKTMIADSLTAVGGRPIYYYSAATGSRILTCQQFSQLVGLDDEALRAHLLEVADLARRSNARGFAELALFMADSRFPTARLAGLDVASLPPSLLRSQFIKLAAAYAAAVPADFQRDDPEDPAWRSHLYATLIGQPGDELSEADLLGLSSEFYMQVEWLPGARIESGELLFDSGPVESSADAPADAADGESSDSPGPFAWSVHGLICNIVQELSDLEFINIGRVVHSLSKRVALAGRREVYVAHFRQRGATQDTVQILRMLKWGVRERLDAGQNLLQAMLETEEYTDYILDRRLGCLQLGMNLPWRVWTRKLAEHYAGRQQALVGKTIWSPYLHRDFIEGFVTDKIPQARLKDRRFATALARLLGRAAASNLIVGRCDANNRVLFDDGDEVVMEDSAGLPQSIVVSDPTGSFGDYQGDLLRAAINYADPVNRRSRLVEEPPEFAEGYLAGFLTRFREIQADYFARRRAFDGLFKHRPCDPAGSFAWRWRQVLRRLETAKGEQLVERIRAGLRLG